jgi:hypothetical protein
MFALNLVLSLIVAVVVWYIASRGLAQLIFSTEARNPNVAGRPLWAAFEAGATFAVFILSVGVWIGLTYLLEMVNR